MRQSIDIDVPEGYRCVGYGKLEDGDLYLTPYGDIATYYAMSGDELYSLKCVKVPYREFKADIQRILSEDCPLKFRAARLIRDVIFYISDDSQLLAKLRKCNITDIQIEFLS